MEFTFVDDDAPPPTFRFEIVDHEETDQQARVMWAGRPTTLAKIRKVAAANKVSPETIMELGSTAGHIESRLASTAAGQLVLRAGEGIKSVGESITANVARATGYPDIAARIHADRRQREEFLTFVEKGGDLQSVLGDRGSRVFGQTAQSLGAVGSAAVAGPVGIYAHAIGSNWEEGLDEAQRHGMDGGDAIGHAGRKAVIDAGLTFLMGRAGKSIGLESLEESLSPAAKNAVAKQLAGPGIQGTLKRVAKEFGGWSAEGVEEMLIAGGQQVNEMSSGHRAEYDWESILEAGASGVAGRGAVGAIQQVSKQIGRIEKILPDVAAGARAAEIDIERGMNPLELKDYVGDVATFGNETGRTETSKTFRDSYRDALDFYVDEARKNGDTGALAKLESDVAGLRAEDRARAERVRVSKENAKNRKPGEPPAAAQPAEPPRQTANERAAFSLADFEKRVQPPLVGETVTPPKPNVNPYLLAPWESETRQQRRIRKLSEQVAGYKETIKGMRADFTSKRQLREEQYTAARELVQENIPTVEQYKYLNAIQKAKSPKAIDKLLGRIESAVDARDHKLAVMDLKQAFSKASNLRTEFKTLVQSAKGGIDFRAIKNIEAAKAIRDWAKENPQAILTDKDRETINRLEQRKNVNDMSSSDIRDLSEYVQRLAYESKVKDRIIGNMQSAAIRDVGDQIAKEASTATKREMQSQSILARQRAAAYGDDVETTLGQERTFGSRVIHEFAERPEATLKKLSPTLNDHIYNKLAIQDQNNYDLAARDVTLALSGVFDSLGLTHDDSVISSVQAIASHNATPLEAWRNQKRMIEGVSLTRGEALMIQRWMQDPHAAKSVTNAGIELDDGKRVLPAFTPKMLAELADFVGGQGNIIANHMYAYDNGPLIDAVNLANEKLTGRSLTDKRNVVPIVRADDDFSKLLTTGRTAAGYQEALLDSYGTFKQRTNDVSALKIPKGMDAIDMFMAHADRMNRFASFSVNARNAEMILNDPAVKNAILEKNGRQGYDHIVDAVKAHVVGGSTRAHSEGERALSAVNAAVVGSQIAGRVSILLQQGLDPVTAAAWDEGGFKDLAAGYGELTQRGLQAVENEMEQVLGQHSGNYWRRYKSEDFVGEHTSGQFKQRSYFRPSALTQHFMRPTSRAEFFAAAMPNYLAAKAQARRHFGLPADDFSVHDDSAAWIKTVVTGFDKKTYRGSNSSHGLELSGVLRYAKSNPMAASLTNFYNTASKVYSLYTMGVERAAQGRVSEGTRYLSAAAVNAIAVATISAAMSHGEKEKEKLSFSRRVLHRMLTGLVSLNPFGGQLVANEVVGPILGAPSYGDNPSLVAETGLRTAKGAVGLVAQLADISDQTIDPQKFNEKLSRNVEDFLVGLASLRGLPLPGALDLKKRWDKRTLAPGLAP